MHAVAAPLSTPALNARYDSFEGVKASTKVKSLVKPVVDSRSRTPPPAYQPLEPSVQPIRPVEPSAARSPWTAAYLLFLLIQPISVVLSSIFMASVLLQAILVDIPAYRYFAFSLGRLAFLLTAGRIGWSSGPPPPEREPVEADGRKRAPSAPGPFTPSQAVEDAHRKAMKDEKLTRDPKYYVEQAGYELEEHSMYTTGGWELKLHRVIDPERRLKRRGYPILIMHGLFQCSGVFFCNEKRSLPFVLAELGYDVWLGNQRGVWHAGHRTLTKWNPAFWHWNIRDLGRDVDEMVSFVLQQSSYPKLAYIGHSQGNASAFLALSRSERPELGRKLSCFVALAPAVFAGPIADSFPLTLFKRMGRTSWTLVFGQLDFLPEMAWFVAVARPQLLTYCGYKVLDWTFGWSDRSWLKARKDKNFRFTPTVSSSENIYWWTGNDGFCKHGAILDPAVEPWFTPDCPPIALFYGDRDYLCDGRKLQARLEGVEAKLAGVKLVTAREIEGYEHMIYWSDSSLETCFVEAESAIRSTLPEGYTPEGPSPL